DVDLKTNHWLELVEPAEYDESDDDCIARRLMRLDATQCCALVVRMIAEEYSRSGDEIRMVLPEDEDDEDELTRQLLASPCEELSERLVFWADVLTTIRNVIEGRAPRPQYYSHASEKARELCCRLFRANSGHPSGLALDRSMIE